MPGSNNYRMTERDYRILQDIGRCGALTAEQIGVHHFGWAVVRKGKKYNQDAVPQVAICANCQRRMRHLHSARLIKRVERFQLLREGKQPYLYTLTPHGAQLLAQYVGQDIADLAWRHTDPRLRPNYIEHLILTNDIRLALERAAQQSAQVQLVRWHDEVTLEQQYRQERIPIVLADGRTQDVAFLPDAQCVLKTRDGALLHYFVEVDRATEVILSSNESYRTWERKMRSYEAFFTNPLYRQRYELERCGLLTITTSWPRLERLWSVTEGVVQQPRFWFSTHRKLTEPKIVQRPERHQGESEYIALMPDVLSEAHWFVTHRDNTAHRLLEGIP